MVTANKFITALATGVAVVAIGSLASAAISPERYAAIERCTKKALAQYPDTTNSNQNQRSAVYEACMAAAGQAP